jgi:hypothetical protein
MSLAVPAAALDAAAGSRFVIAVYRTSLPSVRIVEAHDIVFAQV